MCLAALSCTVHPVPVDYGDAGMPVLFSAGDLADVATRTALGVSSPYYYGMTSTSGVPYMPLDGRFVCAMYYHSAANDTDDDDFDVKDAADGGTMTTAWLKVNNNVGNSVYWNKEYADASDGVDTYGFDKNASCFYWQNRLTHAFLALTDYNRLGTNDGATTDPGKLKLYPDYDKKLFIGPGLDSVSVNTFDLTRGTRTSMAQQPDPLLALTIMKPAGATPEANRVRLYFKHQFSQIQVNLKGADDFSAEITPEQIDSVLLLGISTEGYVCNRLGADGTVEIPGSGTAVGKDVVLDEFEEADLAKNEWGTSFKMFDMATGVIEDGQDTGYAIGYLKSFNAIAFGHLWAIRITWHEESGISHTTTFEVPSTSDGDNVPLRNLQSGIKYVYDLELRRGTLAVIRTEILNWDQEPELVYGADGTIDY